MGAGADLLHCLLLGLAAAVPSCGTRSRTLHKLAGGRVTNVLLSCSSSDTLR